MKLPFGGESSFNLIVPERCSKKAAIAWHENRRKWVGEVTRKSESMPKDPIISWSTTYEDLLSTTDPFSERIPLTEMVDFLVDIWHDEGLYD